MVCSQNSPDDTIPCWTDNCGQLPMMTEITLLNCTCHFWTQHHINMIWIIFPDSAIYSEAYSFLFAHSLRSFWESSPPAWYFISQNSLLSSLKFKISLCTSFSRLLMRILNKIGPHKDSLKTSLMSWPLQNWPLNPTCCFLSNHLSIHKRTFDLSLRQFSFLERLWLKTMSEAFRKSKYTQCTRPPLSTQSLAHTINWNK